MHHTPSSHPHMHNWYVYVGSVTSYNFVVEPMGIKAVVTELAGIKGFGKVYVVLGKLLMLAKNVRLLTPPHHTPCLLFF